MGTFLMAYTMQRGRDQMYRAPELIFHHIPEFIAQEPCIYIPSPPSTPLSQHLPLMTIFPSRK